MSISSLDNTEGSRRGNRALEAALATISAGAAGRDANPSFPAEPFRRLASEGVLEIPVPGPLREHGRRTYFAEEWRTLLTTEPYAPYNRPPLTKEYLRGEASREDLPIESETWYGTGGLGGGARWAAASNSPTTARCPRVSGPDTRSKDACVTSGYSRIRTAPGRRSTGSSRAPPSP
jgi:hypothetical protein